MANPYGAGLKLAGYARPPLRESAKRKRVLKANFLLTVREQNAGACLGSASTLFPCRDVSVFNACITLHSPDTILSNLFLRVSLLLALDIGQDISEPLILNDGRRADAGPFIINLVGKNAALPRQLNPPISISVDILDLLH